jgi:RNA polymerase sigma-70 factor (sigma-E family)
MGGSVLDEPKAVSPGHGGASFEAFVSARGDALWRSAWLLTGDHQLAEDLVQTALAKSCRVWDRIGPHGFEAYVRRAMFTTYASWWRRKWRAEHPTAHVPEAPAPGQDGDWRLDMMRALAALPRGQRVVVVLRYFEDLTERQTAEVLGVNIGTVKSQNARALGALRASPRLTREESADE